VKPKISMITLGVSDLVRSLAFYRRWLGFEPHNYKDGELCVMFRLEGVWLALYPCDSLAEDAQVPPERSGFPGFTLAHNVKSKADADLVFAQAIAAGATSIKTPQDVFWGGYSGYIGDPDGFLWEVAFNPFTDLT
jgi:catechol 2,3-dioxygenase-like lactoylglutathione lyase family enzyme